MSDNDYVKTPNGDYFVKGHVKKGILPEILEELIAARKKAKVLLFMQVKCIDTLGIE